VISLKLYELGIKYSTFIGKMSAQAKSCCDSWRMLPYWWRCWLLAVKQGLHRGLCWLVEVVRYVTRFRGSNEDWKIEVIICSFDHNGLWRYLPV